MTKLNTKLLWLLGVKWIWSGVVGMFFAYVLHALWPFPWDGVVAGAIGGCLVALFWPWSNK